MLALGLDDLEELVERERVDLDDLARPRVGPRQGNVLGRRLGKATGADGIPEQPAQRRPQRAAVRTDRDTAVRNRSTWTEEVDEIGSLPKAGTMWTRSALSSDSHARTDTWPLRESR